jgi:2-polyprenyl-3-methyl-5-hydroxy-6-metoxy-1,4-benzoquinol methylase
MNPAPTDEQAVVDQHAVKYYGEVMQGVDRRVNQFAIDRIVPRLRGPRLLELGCGDGGWTDALAAHLGHVTVVDGSKELLARLQERLGAKVTTHNTLFEELAIDDRFDEVICAHVLEHVIDPVHTLATAHRHLRPGGKGMFLVPNAESLHRRIGVAMGILRQPTDLSDSDRFIGHRRVYTVETLAADMRAAGFEVLEWGGVFLKPLSNAQMEPWPPELLAAFDRVGVEAPRWCVQIWMEGRKA